MKRTSIHARPAPGARDASVRVVGVGASAGGLEAFEAFLRGVPPSSGLAFVLVQHLDPTHEALLAELLQRRCPMQVREVGTQTRLEADHVYVIPPGKSLTLVGGKLRLSTPTARRGHRLPIDHFFASLAEQQGNQAIGVVLSGMGTDGTLGLQAIKARGGATFVQAPSTAGFAAMPTSAIATGVVDEVAPAAELGVRIVAHARGEIAAAPKASATEGESDDGLADILVLLRAHTGHDFSLYKSNTVRRRVERRVAIHQLDGMLAYVRFLQENAGEIELLFKDLLIGVTSFFRDPKTWEALAASVLPSLLKDRPAKLPLRAWAVGCSTGEEAYSLAIVMREVLDRVEPTSGRAIQVFATDLDRDAIAKARAGVFSASAVAELAPERLSRFFVASDGEYQVTKSIRETVVFAPHDVLVDPPFTKVDLVSCRNLLIYLTPELQGKLLPLFHHSLNRDGVLFLGSAETIGSLGDLFAPFGAQSMLFRRLEARVRSEPLPLPLSLRGGTAAVNLQKVVKPPQSFEAAAERLVATRFGPPAVITNEKGDILFVNGKTGRYLEPAAGKSNWNLFAMARAPLRSGLSEGFRKAQRREAPVRFTTRLGTTSSGPAVELTVLALREPELLRGLVLVVFNDSTPVAPPSAAKGKASGGRTAELEREVAALRRELALSHREMQSSREALNATNEELHSANEELQSTNEELTTSKEEMQSMNEELQTLNQELQSRVDDLSKLTNDMKNLLDNTDIATVFLDVELRVRLFSAGSRRIYSLIPSDVGRPITDFSSRLGYPQLPEDAREVLRTLVPKEGSASTDDGRWFLTRVMPYRTLSNTVDGVAITFTDITASKTLEGELRATQAVLEKSLAEEHPGRAVRQEKKP